MKVVFIYLCFGLIFSVQEARSLDEKKAKTSNKKKLASQSHIKTPSKKTESEISKTNSKSTRQISQFSSVKCLDYFNTKYEIGYVKFLIVPCEPNSNLCMSYSEFLRNQCENNQLIRYYCNSESEEGYSDEIIPCEKGCRPGSGKCRQ